MNYEKHGEKYNAWLAYAQSKTANILFTTALANKLKSKGVLSFALNPGRTYFSPLLPFPLSQIIITTPCLCSMV